MKPRWRRATAASVGLIGVVLVLTNLAWPVAAVEPAAGRHASDQPLLAEIKPREIGSIDAYADISGRVIFTPSRRPSPPPPPKQPVIAAQPPPPPPRPAAPPALPQAQLIAIAIAPDRREIMVRLPTRKSLTLVEGEKLDNWTLTSVWSDHVVFRSGEFETQMSFPVARPNRPPAPQKPLFGQKR